MRKEDEGRDKKVVVPPVTPAPPHARSTAGSPGAIVAGGGGRPQEGGVDGGYPGGAAARKDLRNPPLSPATQVLPKRFARALDPLRALRRAPASAGQPPCHLDQRPGLGGAHHLQPRLGDGVSPGISPISESDYSVKYQSREGRFASLPRSTPWRLRARAARWHPHSSTMSAGDRVYLTAKSDWVSAAGFHRAH